MIELQDLTKSYRTRHGRHYVFRDLNFRFPEKANIALIGPNGAGKSTLLRIIGGIEAPDHGRVVTDKRISFPVGLSGGFQGTLTGRDNAKFVCRVYGANADEVREKVQFVEDFAELGKYFDMPIKTYSSGMRSRLIFGLSMAFDFEYYLLDEVGAVGDAGFKAKSRELLEERIGRANIICVSHSMELIRSQCDQVVLLRGGQASLFADIEEGIRAYQGDAYEPAKKKKKKKKKRSAESADASASSGDASRSGRRKRRRTRDARRADQSSQTTGDSTNELIPDQPLVEKPVEERKATRRGRRTDRGERTRRGTRAPGVDAIAGPDGESAEQAVAATGTKAGSADGSPDAGDRRAKRIARRERRSPDEATTNEQSDRKRSRADGVVSTAHDESGRRARRRSRRTESSNGGMAPRPEVKAGGRGRRRQDSGWLDGDTERKDERTTRRTRAAQDAPQAERNDRARRADDRGAQTRPTAGATDQRKRRSDRRGGDKAASASPGGTADQRQRTERRHPRGSAAADRRAESVAAPSNRRRTRSAASKVAVPERGRQSGNDAAARDDAVPAGQSDREIRRQARRAAKDGVAESVAPRAVGRERRSAGREAVGGDDALRTRDRSLRRRNRKGDESPSDRRPVQDFLATNAERAAGGGKASRAGVARSGRESGADGRTAGHRGARDRPEPVESGSIAESSGSRRGVRRGRDASGASSAPTAEAGPSPDRRPRQARSKGPESPSPSAPKTVADPGAAALAPSTLRGDRAGRSGDFLEDRRSRRTRQEGADRPRSRDRREAGDGGAGAATVVPGTGSDESSTARRKRVREHPAQREGRPRRGGERVPRSGRSAVGESTSVRKMAGPTPEQETTAVVDEAGNQ